VSDFDPQALIEAAILAEATAADKRLPPSREVVTYQARRADEPAQRARNRRARIRALRLAWEGRGIAWDKAAAEALVDGRKGLALRHFAREGVVPGADRSDVR